MDPLSFLPFSPAPDVGFWHELMQRKLDVLRLDSSPLPVCGYFEAAGKEVPKCFLLRESFNKAHDFQGMLVRGDLRNFNTAEEFREFLGGAGRKERVAVAGQALREAIISGSALRDPVLLRPLAIIAFADLKKYHFAHTVSFPVLAPPSAWRVYSKSESAETAGLGREALSHVSAELRDNSSLREAGAFLLVRDPDAATWLVKPLAELVEAGEDHIVAFVDPSTSDDVPGWPLRNLILAVAHHRPGRRRVLAFRDLHLCTQGPATALRSRVFFIDAAGEAAAAVLGSPDVPPEAVIAGWSKIQNVDLTVFLDKKVMAADAVDLNIKLMQWRLVPELVPERMKSLKFLLLGSGTLGCSVARTLMGWGVRHMTFVDSGKVSLSNPVRQSLFTHEDAATSCLKAQAAERAVKAVMPDAETAGIALEIPMPGHPHQSPVALREAVQKLEDLVASHDVVCMMTDSRESRWLPSLLVAAKQDDQQKPPPLGITVALGFDSFLVCRQTHCGGRAACYFCNDVTAPSDSIANRTLDQQCTVTRPGLAGMASSIAVELIAALVQHEHGFSAAGKPDEGGKSPLGMVPHQIRGYLANYRLAPAETEPFRECICCSEPILSKYRAEGLNFIERVITDSSILEEVSGLARMKAAVREDEVVSFDDFDEAL